MVAAKTNPFRESCAEGWEPSVDYRTREKTRKGEGEKKNPHLHGKKNNDAVVAAQKAHSLLRNVRSEREGQRRLKNDSRMGGSAREMDFQTPWANVK